MQSRLEGLFRKVAMADERHKTQGIDKEIQTKTNMMINFFTEA